MIWSLLGEEETSTANLFLQRRLAGRSGRALLKKQAAARDAAITASENLSSYVSDLRREGWFRDYPNRAAMRRIADQIEAAINAQNAPFDIKKNKGAFRKLALRMATSPLDEVLGITSINRVRALSQQVLSAFINPLGRGRYLPELWNTMSRIPKFRSEMERFGVRSYNDFVAGLEHERIESILKISPPKPDYKAKPIGSTKPGIARPIPQVNRWVNVVSAAVDKTMFIPLAVQANNNMFRDNLVGLILIHFKTGQKNYTYYDRSVNYNVWADCTGATIASREVAPGVWKPLRGFWSRFLRATSTLRLGNKKDEFAGYGYIEKRTIRKGYGQLKRLAEGKDRRYQSLLKYSGYEKMPTIKGVKLRVNG